MMNTAKHNHLIHPKYRPDIDGLRAVAVLAVVGFHAFPDWIHGGFVGVDIFFVISGYLISTIIMGSLKNGTFSFSEFYSKRVIRIFPSLIVVIASCLVLGWFVLLPDEYKELGKNIAWGVGFISNLVLWSESGYFDPSSETKPLLHLWSLGIEEQFYIFWPLLIYLGWKIRTNLVNVIVVIAVVSFCFNVGNINIKPVAAFYSPVSRFWELLVGAFIALMQVANSKKFILDAIQGFHLEIISSILGLLLICYSITYLNKNMAFPGWWAIFPTLGAAFIIAAGSNTLINRVVLSNKVLVGIGKISYPLYLWHWPLLSFGVISENNSTGWNAAALLGAVFLSVMTYIYIERPLRFGKTIPTKTAAKALISIAIILGILGISIFSKNGYPSRFPSGLKEIIQFSLTEENFSLESYRWTKCFLGPSQKFEDFDKQCLNSKNDPLKKSIVLWGDSHAAHLYPGLAKMSETENFNLIQLTKSSCAYYYSSSLDIRNNGIRVYPQNCEETNQQSINLIRKLKPDSVVLASNFYGVRNWEITSKNLHELAKELHSKNIKNVYLIGPTPEWKPYLPKILLTKLRADGFFPERLTPYDSVEMSQLESKLRSLSAELKMIYRSPMEILCNSKIECLVTLPMEPISPISYDAGHYSRRSSEYLAKLLFPDLLTEKKDN